MRPATVTERECRLTCTLLRAAARAMTGRPPVLTSVATTRPLVALTFDDGPDLATTPALLEVLSRHQATATFFLHGSRASAHPSIVAAVATAGHELGNHLWDDRASILLAPEGFRTQVRRVDDCLSRHGLVSAFRPGSGWFSPRMLRDARALGYRCVLGSPWLVATTYPRDPAALGRRLATRAHPGAVIVLHEGTPDRSAVVATTGALLGALLARGLRAVSVAELHAVGGQ